MKDDFLSIILCLVMIIGTVPMNIMAYKAENNQSDEIQTYADAGAAPLGDGTVQVAQVNSADALFPTTYSQATRAIIKRSCQMIKSL